MSTERSISVCDMSEQTVLTPWKLHASFVLGKHDLSNKTPYVQFLLGDETGTLSCVAFGAAAHSIVAHHNNQADASARSTPCTFRVLQPSRQVTVKDRDTKFAIYVPASLPSQRLSNLQLQIGNFAKVGIDVVIHFSRTTRVNNDVAIQQLERGVQELRVQQLEGSLRPRFDPLSVSNISDTSAGRPWEVIAQFVHRGDNFAGPKVPYVQFLLEDSTATISCVAYGQPAKSIFDMFLGVVSSQGGASRPLPQCSLRIANPKQVIVKQRNPRFAMTPLNPHSNMSAYELQIKDTAKVGEDVLIELTRGSRDAVMGDLERGVAGLQVRSSSQDKPAPTAQPTAHQPAPPAQAATVALPARSSHSDPQHAVGTPHEVPQTTDAASNVVGGRWEYIFKPSCFGGHHMFKCSIRLRRENLRWVPSGGHSSTRISDAAPEPSLSHSKLITGRGDVFEAKVLEQLHAVGQAVDYVGGIDKQVLKDKSETELIGFLRDSLKACSDRLQRQPPLSSVVLAQVCLPVPPALQAHFNAILVSGCGANLVTLIFPRCFPDFIVVTRNANGVLTLRVADCKSSAKRKKCHELQISFYVACLQEWFKDDPMVNIDAVIGEVWLPPTVHNEPYHADSFALGNPLLAGLDEFFSSDLVRALKQLPTQQGTGESSALTGIEDAWLAKRTTCEGCSFLSNCKNNYSTRHILGAHAAAAVTGDTAAHHLQNRLWEAWPQHCRSYDVAQREHDTTHVLQGTPRMKLEKEHANAVDFVYLRKGDVTTRKKIFVFLSRGNPSTAPSNHDNELLNSHVDDDVVSFTFEESRGALLHTNTTQLLDRLFVDNVLSASVDLVCWSEDQRRLLRRVVVEGARAHPNRSDCLRLAAAIFEDFSLLHNHGTFNPRALESASICAVIKESFEALLDLSEPLPLRFGDAVGIKIGSDGPVATPSSYSIDDLFASHFSSSPRQDATTPSPSPIQILQCLGAQWNHFLQIIADSQFVLEPPPQFTSDGVPSTLGELVRQNVVPRNALGRFLTRVTKFSAFGSLEECLQSFRQPVLLSSAIGDDIERMTPSQEKIASGEQTAPTFVRRLTWSERDQSRLSVAAGSGLLGSYRYFVSIDDVTGVEQIWDSYGSYFGSGRCDVVCTLPSEDAAAPGTIVGIHPASNKASRQPLLLTNRFLDYNTGKVLAALDAESENEPSAILAMLLNDRSSHAPERPDVDDVVDKWVTSRGQQRTPSADQLPVLKHLMKAPLTLLWGPPGTGKTTTISHLLKCVGELGLPEFAGTERKPRILITATTKDALHAIMLSLWKLFGGATTTAANKEDDVATNLYEAPASSVLGAHLSSVVYLDGDDLKSSAAGNKTHRALTAEGVVVLTTPWQAHKLLTDKKHCNKFKPFDVLIIDEASQMPVAHSLVVSRLLRGATSSTEFPRVLCAGDLLQLPPILPENISASIAQLTKELLGRGAATAAPQSPLLALLASCSGSILQALMRKCDGTRLVDASDFIERRGAGQGLPWENLIQLKTSRRSVPSIVAFVAEIYPAGLLHGGPSLDVGRAFLQSPKLLQPQHQQRASPHHTLSLHETLNETNTVVELIYGLLHRLERDTTVHIVTPHRRQRQSIQLALERTVGGLTATSKGGAGTLTIAVSTTEKSQGLEADIVVLAMADGISYDSPFPFNLFRLNVAVSRAKHQVVLLVKSKTKILEALDNVAELTTAPKASVAGTKLLKRLVESSVAW
ncbi:Hypothetical protein, putative [Bodo saltans]|uniref:AAA+ ATPase domain-containing protein n=1 Tax=Bodo saltans TaxID=75058 RepID=A0A0S4KI14_BODSA|nr:Hypothetical protein, putative [Bodo saltans]|eukprot:CUI14602.1 Hypothetical protein, putative [Bodo saltans]